MFARLLVPLDGSRRSERAIPYAAGLAKAFDGELVLVHDATFSARGEDVPLTADPMARIAHIATGLSEMGLRVRMQVVHGAAAEAILRAADDEQADLIVMSTHGRSGLGRWLYGSVADAVLRETTRPIVLVSAACERDWSIEGPFRLLVALDGSALAEQALAVTGDVADALRAEVVLLRVVESADGFPALATTYIPVTSLEGMSEAQRYLDGISTVPSLAGCTVSTQVEEGDPAATIATVAREHKVDLIVMATHARGGLARLTMGSVATATLHRATVPMLFVRSAAVPGTTEATADQPDREPVAPRQTIPIR